VCGYILHIKLSAQRNDTETKVFCVSVSFRYADSFMRQKAAKRNLKVKLIGGSINFPRGGQYISTVVIYRKCT